MCCGGHVVLELAACVCLSRLLYSADAVLVGHLLGPVLSWELMFFGGGRSCNSAPFFKNTVFQFWYESITGAKTFYPCRLADSESLRTPVFLAPVLVCLMLTSVAGVV